MGSETRHIAVTVYQQVEWWSGEGLREGDVGERGAIPRRRSWIVGNLSGFEGA